jgi:hypothetical protein
MTARIREEREAAAAKDKPFDLDEWTTAFFKRLREEVDAKTNTVEDMLQEIENVMMFEDLEEELKAKAINRKKAEIQNAKNVMDEAQKNNDLTRMEYAEKLLKWAQSLDAPDE